ncbi:thioesterase domain-containing protein [Chitiniphilus purpureus]|uniref:Thioesterase domain-containing protein n=1 Tax=Chitiniphilus purpureus TaxID=2981137 RepID=A0ABY6DRJ6_9NEIS|nr:thioesterase domain-containing protein [Chitiniphilus sp. CD1]UXY16848.1 thioesterase domain-containing protein [Chitiniphilus sp. CD1]
MPVGAADRSTFAAAWQARLVTGFPLLAAMQIEVGGDAADWWLTAPFAPNRNDHGTAFGASISTLATIAGWMGALLAGGTDCDAVIQSGSTEFLHPITGAFHARPQPPGPDEIARAHAALRRGRPARLSLRVTVLDEGMRIAAQFEGRYVLSPCRPGQ